MPSITSRLQPSLSDPKWFLTVLLALCPDAQSNGNRTLEHFSGDW